MDNKTISDIFIDVYNQFWIRWRDNVPLRGSEQWSIMISEANAIKAKYGARLVRKWEGPTPTMEEEPTVSPLVNWFIDELEARERTLYGKESQND